jgi:multiple sugar transport system substrate-binding protein
VINSPETVAAVEFGVKWFKESMAPEMLGWDETSNNRSYLAGECWATNNGATIYLAALKEFPDIAKVSDHGPNPRGPNGRFYLGDSASFGIPTYVKDHKAAEELLLWMHEEKQYNSYMDVTLGWLSAPLKKYQSHPIWNKDPKMAIFKDISEYGWPGWPGPASPASSEAHYKFIIVGMFAKAMQGMAPKDAVAWAEGELKRIYEKA